MVIQLFFGVLLLTVIGYVLFRMVGNIAIGVLLVLAIFVASYLLLGSFPKLGDIPLIGKFIPTTGKAIAIIKDNQYSMDVIGVSRTSDQNILVNVVNTGKSDLSNFTANVDGRQVDILNNKDSLKSGDVVVFELDWKNDFDRIMINADKTEAVFEYPS